MAEEESESSVFQAKYEEFVEDLLGALPEYAAQIQAAKALGEKERLQRFQEEVKVGNTLGNEEESSRNPGRVLPGVSIDEPVWNSLSENTKKAIWEYVRILSICCFMEAGFGEGEKPDWMDEAMNEMKSKLESVDFQNIIKKFMTFFKPSSTGEEKSDTGGTEGDANNGAGGLPNLENMFKNGFPQIPEKFLKGHMAKLAQEIVKDITPEDLGISPELVAECEKNPSRAFDILFSIFGSNPGAIQKTVQKIGKRLQQKVASGAIRPQEIAREAEELMKEFASNSSFVEMLSGLKGAFGFEDLDLARQAGRESSARLSMVKERLKKKAAEKEAKKTSNGTNAATLGASATSVAQSEAIAAALIREEESRAKKQQKRAQKK